MRPWTAYKERAAERKKSRLQWGHGLAAVDGQADTRSHAEREALQWGHGLAAVDGACLVERYSVRACFNGATALRPWTVGVQGRRMAA